MEDFLLVKVKLTSSRGGAPFHSIEPTLPCILSRDSQSSTGPKLLINCPQHNLCREKGLQLKKIKVMKHDHHMSLKTDGVSIEIPWTDDTYKFCEVIEEWKNGSVSQTQQHPSYKIAPSSSFFAKPNINNCSSQSSSEMVGRSCYGPTTKVLLEKKNVHHSQGHGSSTSVESPMPTRIRPSSISPYTSPSKPRPGSGYHSTYSGSPMINRSFDPSNSALLDHLNDRVPDCTQQSASNTMSTRSYIAKSQNSVETSTRRISSSTIPEETPGKLVFEVKNGNSQAENGLEDWKSPKKTTQRQIFKQFGKHITSSVMKLPDKRSIDCVASPQTPIKERRLESENEDTRCTTIDNQSASNSNPSKHVSNTWLTFMKSSNQNQRKLERNPPSYSHNQDSSFDSPIKSPTSSPLPIAAKPQSNKLNFGSQSMTRSQPSNVGKGVFKGGARNLGNSCYMSAIIQALCSLRPFTKDLLSPFWYKLLQQQIDDDVLQMEEHQTKAHRNQETSSAQFVSAPVSDDHYEAAVIVPTKSLDRDTSLYEEFIYLLRNKHQLRGQQKQGTDQSWTTVSNIPSNLFKDVLDLRKLKKRMGKENDMYSGFGQQDAHEFLHDLINRIDNELFDRMKRWTISSLNLEQNIPQPPLSIFSPLSIAAAPFSADKGLQNEKSCSSSNSLKMCSIQKLLPSTYHFESIMKMDFQCISCQFVHDPRYEKYRDLSLDLTYSTFMSMLSQECDEGASQDLPSNQTVLSLDELLNSFMKDEVRDLRCPHCDHGQQVRIKKCFVWLAPTLILQFKRFQYDARTQSFRKVANPVMFKDSFCLSEVGLAATNNYEAVLQQKIVTVNQQVSGCIWDKPSADMDGNDRVNFLQQLESASDIISSIDTLSPSPLYCGSQNDSLRYQLTAVVRHVGKSLESGHYICDLLEEKCNLDESSTLQWRRYNDEKVFPVNKDAVFQEMDTPYILFYCR